jgi:hypothetical protein
MLLKTTGIKGAAMFLNEGSSRTRKTSLGVIAIARAAHSEAAIENQ